MVDKFTEADNRRITWEKDIKGFAPKRYVMKNLVTISTGNAWNNQFYQKTATSLTAGTGSAIKNIARGADFPNVERGTTLKSAIIEQYGVEGIVYWVDILTSNIAVQQETIMDVTDAVVNSVDQEIYDTVTEADTPNLIHELAITAGSEWDSLTIANRNPIQNILDAVALITTTRYPILSSRMGALVLNETDYANLMGNTKVINHPTFKLAAGIMKNGELAELLGLRIVVSPVVTADKALVLMKKKCATWKQIHALTVDVITDPQKSVTIRCSEIGVTQLTNPEAVCLITNTRK